MTDNLDPKSNVLKENLCIVINTAEDPKKDFTESTIETTIEEDNKDLDFNKKVKASKVSYKSIEKNDNKYLNLLIIDHRLKKL